jgi:hypothetical protein
MLKVKEEKVKVEKAKFHEKAKAFSQKLHSNREVVDLDASDTEELAEAVDVLQAAEDAGFHEAVNAEEGLEGGIFDHDISADDAAAEHMFR